MESYLDHMKSFSPFKEVIKYKFKVENQAGDIFDTPEIYIC